MHTFFYVEFEFDSGEIHDLVVEVEFSAWKDTLGHREIWDWHVLRASPWLVETGRNIKLLPTESLRLDHLVEKKFRDFDFNAYTGPEFRYWEVG